MLLGFSTTGWASSSKVPSLGCSIESDDEEGIGKGFGCVAGRGSDDGNKLLTIGDDDELFSEASLRLDDLLLVESLDTPCLPPGFSVNVALLSPKCSDNATWTVYKRLGI